MAKSASRKDKPYPLLRVTLHRRTFYQLHDALIQKMAVESGLSTDAGRSAKLYGMGAFAPTTDEGKKMKTVASIMAADVRVRNMLAEMEREGEKVARVNFGDYLYKREHELRADPEKDTLEFVGRKYVYGYFNYLGFNNLEEFETHIAQTAGPETEMGGAERSPDDDGWVYYIGAYFSVKSFGVRTFVLGINFSNPVGTKYPAKEWGFHKLGDISGSDSDSHKTDVKYDGFAYIADKRWLCVQLEGSEGKNPFFLIGIVPDMLALVKKHPIIRSILLSVSVRHYPVAAEALLIKTTREYALNAVSHYEKLSPELLTPDLSKEESDIIKLYIMLQRRNFYTSPKIVEELTGLNAKGSLLKNFTFLSGVYRILNFGLKRDYIVQSVMVVEPHQYRATLYPYIKKDTAIKNQNLLQQNIVFNISRIRQNKLCLISYGEPGMSVSSYAIFDLETDNGKGFFEGCFISCGYDNRGIIGGYCVVQKVEDDAEEYLKLQEMARKSPEEAELYAKENNLLHLLKLRPMELSSEEMDVYAQNFNLQELRSGLREIWRKKLWKQRKLYGNDYPFCPEMLKWGNRVYILNQPLDCRVIFQNGSIGIAHDTLKISVMSSTRAEAEIAFVGAFHRLYEEHGPSSPMAYWVRKVVDLS